PPVALGEDRDLPLVHTLDQHVVNQALVDTLEPYRAGLEYLRDVVPGLVHARITEHEQRTGRRAVHQPHLSAEYGGQRALAADEGPGDVESLLGQQLVEVVP